MLLAKCSPSQLNQSIALPGEKVTFYKPTGEPLLLPDYLKVEDDTVESPCDMMFVPTKGTMQCEKYQDLTGLGWFGDSGSRAWAADEVTTTGNEMQGTRWPASDEDNLFNGVGYSINSDTHAQFYNIRKTDSFDEIKNLSSTDPTEVVPMRYHEELEVKGLIKTATKSMEPAATPEIPDCDLFKEMEGKDLIDFLMSDEPTVSQPIEDSKKLIEPSVQIKQEEMKETYLAIPRQITSNSEDRRLPKMVILKTPKRTQSELSTINFGDINMTIADRIKISGKRPRTKRYTEIISAANDSNDSNDDDDEDEDEYNDDGDYDENKPDKPSKRARRSSTASSSTSSIDRYRELRDKNNEASRRSRLNRKEKERDLIKALEEAERDNLRLKTRANELEKLVHSLRQLLLQVVLSRGSHNR